MWTLIVILVQSMILEVQSNNLIKQTQYTAVDETKLTTLPIKLEFDRVSLLSCASRCSSSNKTCLSYIYDKITRHCSLGQHDICVGVDSSNPRPLVTLTSGLQVMCDTVTDGGGWTIFQRRVSGTVDFYRNWAEYKYGFGDFSSGNFYLGNENIYLLTSNRQTVLRVDMTFNGHNYFAKYSSFSISNEADGYKLQVGGYTGNAGDGLGYHNGMKFSTFDIDNDKSPGNCAASHRGAWWYNDCWYSDLNGLWGTVDLYFATLTNPSFIEMKFKQF
ncbi:ficolin-2-like [Physella acuta]|uniref:ficolin-2-like n=1 Tax=Physella acuta TaxID=109671 RepID=UPI0027DD3CA1|nr:ficolin-2-like [Physella acuta]